MTQTIDQRAPLPALDGARPSRRGRLGGLLSAGVFGGAVASATIAGRPAAAEPLISESPKLIALGEEIAPRLEKYRAAVQRRLVARATPWPTVPSEIVLTTRKGRDLYDGCYAPETDIEGKEVCPEPKNDRHSLPPRRLLKAGPLKEFVIKYNVRPRTKWGRELKKIIAVAEKYEEACETAIRASGINDAGRAVRNSAYDLQTLAWELKQVQPRTMAGALIYARAILAYDEAAADAYLGAGYASKILGQQMADAIVRLAHEATAS